MIEKLERAIEKVKRLPEDQQAYAALLLEEVASGEVFVVPESHKAAILQGLDEARHGDLVSESEMQELWKSFGV